MKNRICNTDRNKHRKTIIDPPELWRIDVVVLSA